MHGPVSRRAATAALATAISLCVAPGAFASSNGGGASADAVGQVIAAANCHDVYVSQFNRGVIIRGGPKAGYGEPQYNTPDNCDHYYGAPGQLPAP